MPVATKAAAIALPLFVAESTYQGVRSSAIGELLVQLAAVAVIIMVLWNLVDRVRGGTAQKREVSFSAEVVTLKQHEDLRKQVDKIDHERRTSVAELHKKVETAIERLNDRIDKVPERTITLLRETKDLI